MKEGIHKKTLKVLPRPERDRMTSTKVLCHSLHLLAFRIKFKYCLGDGNHSKRNISREAPLCLGLEML